ncbi:MAG: PSD1 and planctomycete cytochrome C domain-containing protein [Opitutaceae bacterium]
MKTPPQPHPAHRVAARCFIGAALAGTLLQTGCRDQETPASAMAAAAAVRPERIDFNRDIRPIFNESCVVCHGGVKMSGNISFVFREDATRAGESGHITIKPGEPENSELIARLTTKDPEKRMPPVDHGDALAPEQIALFRQWIEEGAQWAEHWAFVAPKPQAVPDLDPAAAARARTPVDRFIIDRLARENLALAPEADRATLLRRVSFDLTGLPPTPAEVDAFVNDRAPDAYEKQVERLLASPRYGERWASLWLDLARYADTKGYEKDLGRSIWQYRDWLIDALNRNLPYDQFVIEQLAGDLLPEATLDQRVATAFHRNTQTNDEGGTSDEEFRLAAAQDRAVTTWSAFNGVTFNCVQCHSHPYDPIRHEEYYTFLAFFNSSRDADYENEYPTLRVPDDPARNAEALRLQTEIDALRRGKVEAGKALESEPKMWQPQSIAAAEAQPEVDFELKDGEAFVHGSVPTKVQYDLFLDDPASEVAALRIEVPPIDAGLARHTPEAGFIVDKVEAWVVRAGGVEEPVTWSSFWGDSSVLPDALQGKLKELNDKSAGKDAKPGPPAATFPELPPGGFSATPSLSRTRWLVAVPVEPLILKAGERLKIRLYHDKLITSKPAPVRRVRLSTSAGLRWTGLARATEAEEKWRRINQLENQLLTIAGTQAPVMRELPADQKRETRVFDRGNFMEKTGDPLAADVPELFPPLPEDAPRNRLSLARWLFSPEQPLTARVAVNRYWEQLFGLGIVETLEDFGSVGLPPSHPKLLDWLALHFQNDLDWDVKALLRELVSSATYRQSAAITPELLARDPRNRLLARGPRNRLSAEMVRDGSLFAGGLLSPKMHGPPVMPPQPEGVWNTVYSGGMKWEESEGGDRHRRALYTYLRRSSVYPSFLTFDAPTRDVCAVRRLSTNTPLQALVTLNDPVYVEAALALALRMQKTGGASVEDKIAFGFRLVATRGGTEAELEPLLSLYGKSLKYYTDDFCALQETGAKDEAHAALTAVASALLNVDAALAK